MTRVVEVSAASRLHFGMFSFGRSELRSFGGVGVMVQRPGLRLRFSGGERLQATGAHAERVLAFATRYAEQTRAGGGLTCRIEVLQAPPSHTGLGVGTQLGMSVVAGLDAWLGRRRRDAADLAACSGRGARSAIGVHGFLHGGLLIEAGKFASQALSPLVGRLELPPAWRVTLVRPRRQEGLSGQAERDAFANLPPVPVDTTRALCAEALLRLAPAAIEADFDAFSAAVYRFGRQAGACFSASQAGLYGTPWAAAAIAALRSLGVKGVGQTSWGPTLFAWSPDAAQAESLCQTLAGLPEFQDVELTTTAPCNRPASVRTCDGPAG